MMLVTFTEGFGKVALNIYRFQFSVWNCTMFLNRSFHLWVQM